MFSSASGILHIQPRSQYPPPPPPAHAYFDYLPTFAQFPKLPLEIREIIWNFCLPRPAVLTVIGEIYYDPREACHVGTFLIASFKSPPTNPILTLYHSRVLSCTRVCKESRNIYLKAFPISLPTARPLNPHKPFGGMNAGNKGSIRISQQDRLFIANLSQILYNPYLEEALSSQYWTRGITTLYGPVTSLGTFKGREDVFNAPIWTVFKTFSNLKDVREVVPAVTWERVQGADRERARRYLAWIRRAFTAVKAIHGLEKDLPMFGFINIKDMEAMNERVVRERKAIVENEWMGKG